MSNHPSRIALNVSHFFVIFFPFGNVSINKLNRLNRFLFHFESKKSIEPSELMLDSGFIVKFDVTRATWERSDESSNVTQLLNGHFYWKLVKFWKDKTFQCIQIDWKKAWEKLINQVKRVIMRRDLISLAKIVKLIANRFRFKTIKR